MRHAGDNGFPFIISARFDVIFRPRKLLRLREGIRDAGIEGKRAL